MLTQILKLGDLVRLDYDDGIEFFAEVVGFTQVITANGHSAQTCVVDSRKIEGNSPKRVGMYFFYTWWERDREQLENEFESGIWLGEFGGEWDGLPIQLPDSRNKATRAEVYRGCLNCFEVTQTGSTT